MKNRVFPIVFVCAVWILFLTGCSKKSTVSYVTSKAQILDIKTTITATGTIEPVTQVEIGTQVSGIIDKIYVDYNSIVKKGQIIAELDKTNLVSELTSAQSNLANAQSNLNYQTSNYNRFKTLFEKGLVSANDFESARLTYQQAQSAVKVQTQNVQKAKTNLGYATITSPIDGVVLNRAVEEGQTVASSFNTPTLFTIAQDLTDMRVIANIDEADIGGVAEGQRVTFSVDAYPDDTFEGSVTQVRQEATTESNVVTYEVVVSAPNNDLKLKPGLTANVTIYTMEKNHVLAIPSKALRFVPSDKLLTKDQSIQDCESPLKVWKQEGNVFKAYPVKTGITNGTLTEIVSGLNNGDDILTEITAAFFDEQGDNSSNRNPFMPGPRNRRGQQNKSGNPK